jgi:hypothetical protein
MPTITTIGRSEFLRFLALQPKAYLVFGYGREIGVTRKGHGPVTTV